VQVLGTLVGMVVRRGEASTGTPAKLTAIKRLPPPPCATIFAYDTFFVFFVLDGAPLPPPAHRVGHGLDQVIARFMVASRVMFMPNSRSVCNNFRCLHHHWQAVFWGVLHYARGMHYT